MAGEPILIVDDTPVNLKLTRILLVNEGYRVLTAASAEEALKLLRSYHPRLILADIQLPGMDGLELTRLIKQDERTRDIAVVALTAFAMKGDEQKAIDAGCDGYITKPIDTRTLGERIRQVLTRQAELETPAVSSPAEQEAVSAVEMKALRRRFLVEGQAEARAIFFDLAGTPDMAALGKCDLVVAYVGPGSGNPVWLGGPDTVAGLPTVLVGSRDNLLALDPAVQAKAVDFLMDSWQPEEALVRLSLAIQHNAPRKAQPAPRMAGGGRIRVLVADDDATVLALVRTALVNFGMECQLADDGPKALEAAGRWRPQAAILEVNMPGMDGYEVLAAMRAESLPVRVILLTARQQESDIVRGFTLGADDYVVKPFSPLELVARLKRLILR